MNDCVYDITFGFHYIIHKTFTKTSNYRNYDISAINRVYICMHTSCNFRVLIDEKGFTIAYRWIVLGFQNNIFYKWLFGMSWTFFFLECGYHSFKLYMLFQICLYYTVVCMVHKYNNGNPSRNVDSQRTTISKLEKKTHFTGWAVPSFHPIIRFQISLPALFLSLLAAPSPKTDLFSIARRLRYGRTLNTQT